MRIVIDISEETYNEVCWRGLSLCPRDEEELVKAIKKGTPLDKIRAEIAKIPKKYPMTMDYENGLKEAIGIIDKYKAESEDKEMQIRIIDTTTGKEPTDEVIEKIAKENKLQLFDIDGFGINEDGQIILMDDCGNYAFADNTRFEAKLVEEKREQEPCDDKGEISDGYHTFNQLYHQRAILFATIVNQNMDIAWKSYKHSDGKYCFDSNGEWFIVGIDTPQGSYTYHYSKEYWDYFKCKELDCGKEWDGHTEEDVTRLLSLEQEPKTGWIPVSERLPKYNTPILLALKQIGKERTIVIGERRTRKSGWYFVDIAAYDTEHEVMAWMPLPEPYKASPTGAKFEEVKNEG